MMMFLWKTSTESSSNNNNNNNNCTKILREFLTKYERPLFIMLKPSHAGSCSMFHRSCLRNWLLLPMVVSTSVACSSSRKRTPIETSWHVSSTTRSNVSCSTRHTLWWAKTTRSMQSMHLESTISFGRKHSPVVNQCWSGQQRKVNRMCDFWFWFQNVRRLFIFSFLFAILFVGSLFVLWFLINNFWLDQQQKSFFRFVRSRW